MDFEQKIGILGGAAKDDVACQTCVSNPNSTAATHRAGKLIPATEIATRAQDLTPWLTNVIRSDGKQIPLVKTLMTSACEKDCFYCPFRRGRNATKRETFKPEELAKGMDAISRKGIAKGIFLSSGVVRGGTNSMERMIAAIEILRTKFEYQGYVHLKLMPGAQEAVIEQAMRLADRVSVNLEAPNSERLQRLSSTKVFTDELLAPLKLALKLKQEDSRYAHVSMVSQFVVGAADELDREILATSAKLYHQLHLARVYYSAFHPIDETPLEDHAPTDPRREFRLYQADFLLRQYGFSYSEIVFDEQGNLPIDLDPKTMWATTHPDHFPLEINRAAREQLLRVPGIGVKSAERILNLRRSGGLGRIEDLARAGADIKRAAAFVLLNGKQPARQLRLW